MSEVEQRAQMRHMTERQVWLVTGEGRGLGGAIADAATLLAPGQEHGDLSRFLAYGVF